MFTAPKVLNICPKSTELPNLQYRLTDIPTPYHINPCNQILTVMKYGVNRVTLVGNVGEVPKVSEREGEAFVANFPLATNEVWKDKEGQGRGRGQEN